MGRALDHKSPIFIIAFLLVRILTTSLQFSSLSSYWSGSWPQVSHFHPWLLFGPAFDHTSPISFLPSNCLGSLFHMVSSSYKRSFRMYFFNTLHFLNSLLVPNNMSFLAKLSLVNWQHVFSNNVFTYKLAVLTTCQFWYPTNFYKLLTTIISWIWQQTNLRTHQLLKAVNFDNSSNLTILWFCNSSTYKNISVQSKF